jgi:pilus assembly protein CpaB
LKRSNRLVLLIGVFLAIVAFVGVIVLAGGGGGSGPKATPPVEGPVVVATTDIALSTKIRADQVTESVKPLTEILPGAYTDVSQVIGKVVRQSVTSGAQITGDTFGQVSGSILNIETPAGLRSIAVEVDQVTGVGTVIKTGDYVDMVVGFASDKFPVVTQNPVDDSFQVVLGLNGTSVKLLLQGMQVLGTLLPPASTENQDPNASAAPGTALNDQREIVILAVTPQQVEVIKFAQLDGSISLVLRSAEDFIDPTTGEIIPVVVPSTTTGIILKTLVDDYGVLPPELVETVAPTTRR